jgi:hypothetical protein
MEIKKLEEIKNFKIIYNEDSNQRVIYLYEIENCQFVKDKTFYPDVFIHSFNDNCFYNPINEVIKSLEKITIKSSFNYELYSKKIVEDTPVFYFIYNTDNYFHFVYDTLPYIISYLRKKKEIPELKLLINYPNKELTKIYKFVSEFLELLNIDDKNILLVNEETIYKKIYISSSYTHGHNPDKFPRNEIYNFYKELVEENKKRFIPNTPKKIYISRRSWIHNDYSNIGTNYTLRRKMENEDELVEILKKRGYEEIFTEKMSTFEKLNLFYNAEYIVGAIGGGLCNVLFSKPETKLCAIVSPTFLDVNMRFKYCLEKVDTTYFQDTHHVEKDDYKVGMRVESEEKSIIGEILNVEGDFITIQYVNHNVAGWNNQMNFKMIKLHKEICNKLDNGLNSSFVINLKNFEELISSYELLSK